MKYACFVKTTCMIHACFVKTTCMIYACFVKTACMIYASFVKTKRIKNARQYKTYKNARFVKTTYKTRMFRQNNMYEIRTYLQKRCRSLASLLLQKMLSKYHNFREKWCRNIMISLKKGVASS